MPDLPRTNKRQKLPDGMGRPVWGNALAGARHFEFRSGICARKMSDGFAACNDWLGLMSEIHAKARVQIIVEIDAGAPWGEDCSIGQMYKQAAESAQNSLLNAFKTGSPADIGLRLIGDPKVVGIITEKS